MCLLREGLEPERLALPALLTPTALCGANAAILALCGDASRLLRRLPAPPATAALNEQHLYTHSDARDLASARIMALKHCLPRNTAAIARSCRDRLDSAPGNCARDGGRSAVNIVDGTVRLMPASASGGAVPAAPVPVSKCQTSLGGLCGRCGAQIPRHTDRVHGTHAKNVSGDARFDHAAC